MTSRWSLSPRRSDRSRSPGAWSKRIADEVEHPDRDQAFAHLEAAFAVHDARLALLKIDPKWDDLRSDPRFEWSIDFCYCSVFDECWFVANKWAEPEPVKECVRDESNEFKP